MPLRDDVINEYFNWLYKLVCGDRYSKSISYRKLFVQLHSTEFIYIVPMDENRAKDGIGLRRRFALRNGYDTNMIRNSIDGPCSVLEMMISLAITCEETIMDDTTLGDRTGQWFWEMINNIGLGGMYDSNYDREYVAEKLHILLNREYEPNGKGGLFTIKNCGDIRDAEIWHQLCWYLDNIT